MSLVLQSSGGGQITIQEPATASNFTQTLPAATGTVMVSGNQPAFSATQSVSQNIATGTLTKLTINSEEFDTASCYDNATNYRFTPTVAGYYQVNGFCAFGTTVSTSLITIYKNGSRFKDGILGSSTASTNQGAGVSALIFMNGSTDYVELYMFQNSGLTVAVSPNSFATYFQASMVRAA